MATDKLHFALRINRATAKEPLGTIKPLWGSGHEPEPSSPGRNIGSKSRKEEIKGADFLNPLSVVSFTIYRGTGGMVVPLKDGTIQSKR